MIGFVILPQNAGKRCRAAWRPFDCDFEILLAVISVPEMLGSALVVGSVSYGYAEPMFAVGVLFLAMSLVAVACIRQHSSNVGLG